MIYLTEALVVTADEHQYIMGKASQRKNSELYISNPRYYLTMAQTIRGALSVTLRQGVKDGSIDTLRKFLSEAERLQDDFSRKLAPLEY